MAAKTKYGKCFHSGDLILKIDHYDGKSMVAHKGELDADCSIGYHCIAKPINFDRVHAHAFPEMLGFIGGNAKDITDFGAEIEFTIGGEKHKITKPTIVSIPGNVEHCPINITKVTKPIIFLEISLARIWKPGGPPPKKKPVAKKPAAKKSATNKARSKK
jgi:hypothetical protein